MSIDCRFDLMSASILDCLVEDYEALIPGQLNQQFDGV